MKFIKIIAIRIKLQVKNKKINKNKNKRGKYKRKLNNLLQHRLIKKIAVIYHQSPYYLQIENHPNQNLKYQQILLINKSNDKDNLRLNKVI